MSCKLISVVARSTIRLWFSQGCREVTSFDVNMMRPPASRLTHSVGLIGSSMPPLIAHDLIVNLYSTFFTRLLIPLKSYLFYRRLNSSDQVISRLESNIELFTLLLRLQVSPTTSSQDHLLRRAQSSV